MVAAGAVGAGGSFSAADVHRFSVQALDCGKYSSDRTSPACEKREQTGVGVFAVAAVLLLVAGFIAWRLMLRKVRKADEEQGGTS